MELRIRQAQPEDLHEVARLFDSYRQFYGQPSDVGAGRAFLRERMESHESMLVVVEGDDGLLGFAQLYPMFSSVRLASIWILNDLYVVPEARRHGVGRLLLDACAAAAAGAGASRLVLETSQDNLPARALYLSAGWNEEATQWYSLDLDAHTAVN